MHDYQFNIGDYKSHTDHLDPLEDIAYRRMLDWCYLHEKGLPKDIADVARLIKMRTHTDCIAVVLREFFHLDDAGLYVNKRVTQDINKFHQKSAKAKRSAEARWDKEKGDANALRTQYEGNANHKPITNNHKPKIKTVWSLPENINVKAWQEFEQHRKDIKKPMTDLARTKNANILAGLTMQQQQESVDVTIANRWSGLFPPKESNSGVHQKSNKKPSAVERVRAANGFSPDGKTYLGAVD